MISSRVKQVCASIGPICVYYSFGYFFGLLSVMMPELRKTDSDIKMTIDQESWIASIVMIMVLPTHFLSGILSDIYGRKTILSFSILPIVLSSITAYLATNFCQLLNASIMIGLTNGAIPVGQMFLAEVVSPNRRGAFISFIIIFLPVGQATTLLLGKFFHWRTLIIFNVVPGVIGLVSTQNCPESPVWYASKGRFEECQRAFVWFRGSGHNGELKRLIEKQRLTQSAHKTNKDNRSIIQTLKIVRDRNFIRSTVICFAAILTFELSGKPICCTYVVDLFISITGNNEHANYYALAVVLTDLVATSVSCILVERFKRRTLLFVTSCVALFTLAVFCILSYLLANAFMSDFYSWVMVGSFVVYIFLINVGVLNPVVTVQREIYPVFHRGLGVVVGSFLNGFLLFSVIKLFPSSVSKFGVHGTFALSGAIMVIALTYLYFKLPETSNKTLQDIEHEIGDQLVKPSNVVNCRSLDYEQCNQK